MRVVLDTNVFISAFIIPGSHGERAFLLAQRKRFELVTSVTILTEMAHKLREKFHQTDDEIKVSMRRIGRVATVMKPRLTLSVLQDDSDNRILECAVEAQADLIVTGDRHLLKLRAHEGAAIVRLVDFLRLFPEDTAPTT